jgi:hypothetical protein
MLTSASMAHMPLLLGRAARAIAVLLGPLEGMDECRGCMPMAAVHFHGQAVMACRPPAVQPLLLLLELCLPCDSCDGVQ